MMDREAFDRWLEREARRGNIIGAGGMDAFMAEKKRRTWAAFVAEMQERCAPPVSPEIEAFCASMARQWRKP